MTKLITIIISGIKCDNEGCDYRDDEVNRDNYLEYIDKPCPECSRSLLTQEDYDAVVALEGLEASLDLDISEDLLGDERLYDVNMNGSGTVDLTEREEE